MNSYRSFGQAGDICALAGEIPRYQNDMGGPTEWEMPNSPARDTQVGGNHYAELAIQPRDYARANNFVYEEVLALRYLTRHREKNGKQDLLKLIHCVELLIEAEYGHGPKSL